MNVGRATCFYALRVANLELDSCVRTTAVSVSNKFKTVKLASCFEDTPSEHYDRPKVSTRTSVARHTSSV